MGSVRRVDVGVRRWRGRRHARLRRRQHVSHNAAHARRSVSRIERGRHRPVRMAQVRADVAHLPPHAPLGRILLVRRGLNRHNHTLGGAARAAAGIARRLETGKDIGVESAGKLRSVDGVGGRNFEPCGNRFMFRERVPGKGRFAFYDCTGRKKNGGFRTGTVERQGVS